MRMGTRPRTGLAGAVLLGLGALGVARAAAAGPATDQVKSTVDQILAILQDPQLAGHANTTRRHDRIREIVLQRFSFDDMARRALGPTWNTISSSDRKDFTHLFTELLQRSYVDTIESYSGEKVLYDSERSDGDGDEAEVRTRIVNKRGEETPVVYRLTRSDSAWQVHDLVIDGVSLVNNYRTQFSRIVRTSSYRDLATRLRTKLDAEEAGEPGRARAH